MATTAVPRGERTSAVAAVTRCDHEPGTGASVRGSSGRSLHVDPLLTTPTRGGDAADSEGAAQTANNHEQRTTTRQVATTRTTFEPCHRTPDATTVERETIIRVLKDWPTNS
jgi:hypothetical protein